MNSTEKRIDKLKQEKKKVDENISKLKKKSADISGQIESLENEKIVTAFRSSGFSFETITFLAGKINELGLTSVITIDGSDSKIANTVINETQPKHLNILTLDSMQSITSKDIENGFTYLSVMENNLENIKTALN